MKPGNSTASVDLLVQRGKVVSKGLVSSQWVAVKDGRVVALGCNDGWIPEAKQVVDATNKFVLPGIIDSHNHVRFGAAPDILSLFGLWLARDASRQ